MDRDLYQFEKISFETGGRLKSLMRDIYGNLGWRNRNWGLNDKLRRDTLLLQELFAAYKSLSLPKELERFRQAEMDEIEKAIEQCIRLAMCQLGTLERVPLWPPKTRHYRDAMSSRSFGGMKNI